MFGLTGAHLVIVLLVVLLLFSPKKLPKIGKALGEGMRELKKSMKEMTNSIDHNDTSEPNEANHNAAESHSKSI